MHTYVHIYSMYLCMYVHIRMLCVIYVNILGIVSWCGGDLWVDQRKKCADICDVAQVTDIRTLPN